MRTPRTSHLAPQLGLDQPLGQRVTAPLGALCLMWLVAGCQLQERGAVERGRIGPEGAGRAGSLQRVMALEDARRTGDGELLRIASAGRSPVLRARAVLALARFEREDLDAPATEALVAALDDVAPEVRESAAFGLGLRGDSSAALALIAHWRDPEPSVRAALVEAATRLTDRSLVPHVLRALADPDSRVRAAAADGAQRWPWLDRDGAPLDERALAREIDGALAARALARVAWVVAPGHPDLQGARAPATAAAAPEAGEAPEVVWRALASLARRGAPLGQAAFERWTDRRDAPADGAEGPAPEALGLARLFGAQGLARLAARADLDSARTGRARARLEELASDGDARVAIEALRGLGNLGARDAHDATTVTVLAAALGHRATLVRQVAWEALSAFREPAPIAHLLPRHEDEDAPPARAAAWTALAKHGGVTARAVLARAAQSTDLIERAGAANAAAELPSDAALPLLLALADDPHPKVAETALTGLARHPTDRARRKLRDALGASDSGVRLAAALALRELATEDDLPALQLAALTSAGDAGPEARFEAARTLARIPTASAKRTLERVAHEDRAPYVRRVAQGLLAAASAGSAGSDALDTSAASAASVAIDAARQEQSVDPQPATSIGPWQGPNPLVTFVTTRGDLTFELFPHEAPQHVANLLALIERGAYDRTEWHRVVPDFVAQGGDGRGDGNGGGTWRGPDAALRLEVTRRQYRTGSLGMPRNEDRDSGGRQLFVTHRPTPHLDGRYTLFGELRAGFETLEALIEGDGIVTARVD
ncbi:MAG: peptidylprolyl isomerase [Planctomycetota bacterium]